MSTDDEKPTEPKDPDAKKELFEAIEHFKSAANIFFDRAAKDPTLKGAADEADRVIRKVTSTAEPLAKQLTSELSKLTRRMADAVEGGVDRARKEVDKRRTKPPSGE